MSVTKEQTAVVEWLVEHFAYKTIDGFYTTDGVDDITEIIEQANRMFQEHIEQAYQRGLYNGQTNWGYGSEVTSEQYYNETFKTK
jgi:hypothetical protein